MILTLARMDQLANQPRSPWHRACALSKLMLASGIVLLAVFAPTLALLELLFVTALALAATGRLPLRLIGFAAAYPLLFAGLFIVSHWDGTWATPLRILLRPLTASLVAGWLMSTTPYPDVFAPISRVLPSGVGDALFLTYRALFELLGRLERLWRSLRLRGGTSGPARRRFALAGEGLGTLVLYGFERSQRFYATMQLRGHSGRICGCRHYADWSAWDLPVLLVATGLAVAAIGLWRNA